MAGEILFDMLFHWRPYLTWRIAMALVLRAIRQHLPL